MNTAYTNIGRQKKFGSTLGSYAGAHTFEQIEDGVTYSPNEAFAFDTGLGVPCNITH